MSYVGVTRALAQLALLAGAAGLLLIALLATARGRVWVRALVVGQVRPVLLVAWVAACVATAGSLYFSEIVGFQPCLLCWYQRIAMYPLVLVLGVGVLTADWWIWRYALPLSVSGLLVSAYHLLLQNRPTLVPSVCDASVPCTLRYVAEFGFVSIPYMAGSGFVLISALLLAVWVGSPERDGDAATPPG